MKFLQKISIVFLCLLTFSCGNGNKNANNDVIDPKVYKENLENVNKKLAEKENREIEDYIERHGWDMQKTGTGLRYQIYKKGNGKIPVEKDKVVISFIVNLINGIECYNSKNDGLKLFELGRAEVESGLEEGIKLMHVGDKAKLIIPSHLAFGLLGDENKIPKRATLIYDVELLEIK
ncbi:MAG: FKBP-type peptidyl-prolyl cis-trans isomerase [Bacteroidales bacterium]|jgi:FKBP-type peptidyl-prolyl cis-trans isomerase|nr:FKBP-type peptidyl-prolyl cis-trans isomerase [Bacteroidales bacterium]MDD4214803.1 FKBP-type peptidyl-prolyl cis-trans isomerase [Bacteroidales bacterium]